MESNHEVPHANCQRFRTTQWTTILNAGRSGAEGARALARLCETYWYPLYLFVRRKGKASHDAEDIVQGFFEQLLRHESLAMVKTGKGRFRTFLLASMTNYLSNNWAHQNRAKRGGSIELVRLDAIDAEHRFELAAPSAASPEHQFDRIWAETIFQNVVRALREEYDRAGERERYEILKTFLAPAPGGADSYAEVARRLGLSENGVKTCVRRMRLRFRDLLMEQVRCTVDDSAEIDEEVRYLLAILASDPV